MQVDGHRYIQKAISLGAVVIVCEVLPLEIEQEVTYVQVKNSKVALAMMASNFYGQPSSKLSLVGVTGTNGKTTTASLLFEVFKKLGYTSGLLSTVSIRIDNEQHEATHTTPDAVSINYYLSQMVAAGVTHCFMEVSSHGIHQKRIEGLTFAGGVFTNLTHDHLDYHKTFASYRDVKKVFFDALPAAAFALVNEDDKNGHYMLQNTLAKHYTYAIKTGADFKAKIIEKQFSGTLLNINKQEVWTTLIGTFNVYNLLTIYAVSSLLGVESMRILKVLSSLESVSGRFEYITSSKGVIGIIDYAHTPDALKNVLETIREIRKESQLIISVIGCGGDRDQKKRPMMAGIASQLSTHLILTSDNPRTEDPQKIIDDMEVGVAPENAAKTIAILDRRQAIKTAYKLSKEGDIILIAGKGHESYQEVHGVRSHFDDKEELTNCFMLEINL